MVSVPVLTVHERTLAWTVPAGWRALSSAAVGGGLTEPAWVVNVDVGGTFARTDLSAWAREVAAHLGLHGDGCALLTAADVTQVETAEIDGVVAWSTVGVTRPTWALDPRDAGTGFVGGDHADELPRPGTVNIVVAIPAQMSTSALVQAVGTITEAKAQVLVQAGVPGTGTASDAVVVLSPAPTPDEIVFAGVRSLWGQRIARAVHTSVAAGLASHPWPADDVDPTVVW